MASIDRDGVRIHYEHHRGGPGPTVLPSHGYSATGAMWRGQIDALTRYGDVIVWDNRCVLHRATPYDSVKFRRLMQRTTIAGDGPTVAA